MKNLLKKRLVFSILLCHSLVFGIAQQATIKEAFTLPVSKNLVLAGEIAYPQKPGKYPAAILIWGSGPHTRDQVISGTPIFKQIANELVSNGMAVMRLDKRGYGKSTGDFKSEVNYTTKDLAEDIKIAYKYLNNHKAVDTSRIGLIGHSEGSIIASILSAEDKSIDWVIFFGPSSVSGKEIELDQGAYNRKRLGMTEDISNAVGDVWEEYIDFIKDGYQDDSLYYQIGRSFLMAHGLKKDDKKINNEFIDQLLDAYKTPWYQYFYTHDNRKYIEKIQVPLLAIMGSEDKHTSVNLHFLPMFQALQKSENKNYKIVILADEDHFFFRYKGARMEKHKFGEMEMSKQFLSTMINWLKGQGILK